MKILSLEPIRREARRVQERMSPVAVILAYHRVCEGLPDPQRLMIRPDYFAEQMEALRRLTSPVPLSELVGKLKTRASGDRPLSAVTFDDGYADNIQIALPILRRLGVPATVFVATSVIDRPREMWWDELERIFLQPDLPDSLHIRLGDMECEWSFKEDSPLPGKYWDVYDPPYLIAQKAYLQIAAHLRSCPLREQEVLLAELCEWAGIERCPRDEYRTLTGDEIKQLAADDLISIGSHSISHSNLANMDESTQRLEIGASRSRLTRLTGRSIQTFSYPYGRAEDYTSQTRQVLRHTGFEYACTTVPRLVNRWTSPLQLPRFTVGNWPGRVFKEKLMEFISVSA